MPNTQIQVRRATLGSAIEHDAPRVASSPAAWDSTGSEIIAVAEQDYRPGLPTCELITEIRGLLVTERRAECLTCRYLADLGDRVQARQDAELGVYADELEAARCLFALGPRDTRERVRVGRALRHLPRIERAFMDGELCYSRVREVTHVATVDTELDRLELARRLDMRSLERRVAAEREAVDAKSSRHRERRVDQAAQTQWMGEGRVRVTFDLSTETWALLERAMAEARRAGVAGASDADALEAVVRAALSDPHADTSDAGDAAEPPQWLTSGHGGGPVAVAKPGRSHVGARPNEGGPTRPLNVVAKPGRSLAGARGASETARVRRDGELGVEATQGGSLSSTGF